MSFQQSDPDSLLQSLYNAMGVVMNISGSGGSCYDITQSNPSVSDPIWDYMVCTSGLINEQPYFAATGMPNDMFWKQPVYTQSRIDEHCMKAFGVTPRAGWLNLVLGVEAVKQSSNIVFANGLLDPWHSGGILTNVSDSLTAYVMRDCAHHVDLFFSTSSDPVDVVWVRKRQLEHIRKWIQ